MMTKRVASHRKFRRPLKWQKHESNEADFAFYRWKTRKEQVPLESAILEAQLYTDCKTCGLAGCPVDDEVCLPAETIFMMALCGDEE